ncbi:MAG: hypothetical protein QOI62_4103 [Solirubrobacteraceae bacterium]|jgi:hypothetical protein|nr:hypothetical protein [Solirubrobacteraceae bacterium]
MTRALLALAVALLATLALLAPAAGADPTGLVLVPVGQPPLSDRAAAAAVVRSPWEPRPRNARATHRVPSAAALRAFHRQSDLPYARRVTGRFRGTTDEVIQWAAAKWALAPDLVRSVAAIETWWVMGHVGDHGDSFGLFQVRRPYHCRGRLVCGLFRHDAAFNADYYGAALRSAFDGRQTWLDTVTDNGAPYTAGDLWGAVGLWFAGRWHVPAADAYAVRVEDDLAQRVWSLPSFAL